MRLALHAMFGLPKALFDPRRVVTIDTTPPPRPRVLPSQFTGLFIDLDAEMLLVVHQCREAQTLGDMGAVLARVIEYREGRA